MCLHQALCIYVIAVSLLVLSDAPQWELVLPSLETLFLLLYCLEQLIHGLSSCLIISCFVVLVVVYCRHTIFYRETEVGVDLG